MYKVQQKYLDDNINTLQSVSDNTDNNQKKHK